MTSNSDIVAVVIRQGIIENALRLYNVHISHHDDLQQEVLLILLEMDNERLNDIYLNGKLSHFVTRIVRNQWCSVTSSYYSTYRKYEKKKATNEFYGVTEYCAE